MPIEDINFLYENSVKENMVILVDSNYRDRDSFPTPAEFEINFAEPINFIFGIDILDTTVPRTMFMMDTENNSLFMRYGFDMLSTSNDNVHYFLPQDFSSASTFFQRIESQVTKYGLALDNYDNIFIDDEDTLTNYTNRLLNDYPIMRFKKNTPFLFDMKKSTTYNIFGFDRNTKSADFPKYVRMEDVVDYPSCVNVNLSDETIYKEIHIDTITTRENGFAFKYKHNPEYLVGSFIQSIRIVNNKSFFSNNLVLSLYDETDDISVTIVNEFVFNIFNSTSIVNIKQFNSDESKFGCHNSHLILRNNHVYRVAILTTEDVSDIDVYLGYSYIIKLQNINWNNRTFISKTIADPTQTVSISSSLTNNEHYTLDKYHSITFPFYANTTVKEKYVAISDIGTIKNIEIDVQRDDTIIYKNTFILSLMYDGVPIADILLRYTIIEERHVLQYVNENIDLTPFNYLLINFDNAERYSWKLYTQEAITLIKDPTDNVKHSYEYVFFYEFGLVSPGIINLASENYVLLRCPEIENHLLGSYNSNTELNPGVAVLNIDVQGYASGKSEFYSVQYKEFHPIGKLSKLKFRFERKTDRKLYDFKNVDLHFLMSIKYLAPKQKNLFYHSTLNPNYNANYVNYVNDDFSSSESEFDEDDLKSREHGMLKYLETYS